MADLLIKPLTGAGNTVTIQDQAGGAILTSENSGATLGSGITFPAGHVLQVQSTTSNASIVNTTDPHDVDLMSVNITPTSTSSKVLILINAWHGNENPNGGYTLLRNSTAVGAAASQYGSSTDSIVTYDDVPGGSTYTLHSFNVSYLDSPSLTSSITYKLKASSHTSTYWNISHSGSHGYASSTITAMEIAG